MRAVRLTIAGVVQGVGFRAWTKRTARALGIHGWVKNEADGTVLVHAEGEDGLIVQFIAALHMGPPGAAVDRVFFDDVPVEDFPSFTQR